MLVEVYGWIPPGDFWRMKPKEYTALVDRINQRNKPQGGKGGKRAPSGVGALAKQIRG